MRQQSHQSNSDVHSSRRSNRSRRFRIRRNDGGDTSSRMDSVSMNSGFMSRATKKRGIRKGDKRATSLAMQNELIINKLQEQLVELKSQMNGDI